MSSHKLYPNEQRFLTQRGREFHFVSYAAVPANHSKTAPRPEIPAGWYLMLPGRRQEVMPYVVGQPADEVDLLLLAWLDAHVFCSQERQQGKREKRG